MRRGRYLAGAVIIPILALELLIRLSGFDQVPLYSYDSTIGYVVKPNQEGSFLRRNDWAFNELSMAGRRPFQPSDQVDLLVIGDSVVYGGNLYAEHERLGSVLSGQTQWQVWSAAAGSWGLQNQLTYLMRHPQVARKVDAIVFVVNEGDFDAPSSWTSERSHPTHMPGLRLIYLLRKFGIFPDVRGVPAPVPPWRSLAASLKAWAAQQSVPVMFVYYPTKAEEEAGACGSDGVKRMLGYAGFKPSCLTDSPSWSKSLYRDDIHPSAEGNVELAQFIVTAVASDESLHASLSTAGLLSLSHVDRSRQPAYLSRAARVVSGPDATNIIRDGRPNDAPSASVPP